ncbi:hypothetical protein SDC9_157103 [bioreactor metagenome]|uniref:Uncharacterized protein n=1 Tax=bioreactor metagenome TaxID=1076179 RepID=A0A645F6B7_9ZZZZ
MAPQQSLRSRRPQRGRGEQVGCLRRGLLHLLSETRHLVTHGARSVLRHDQGVVGGDGDVSLFVLLHIEGLAGKQGTAKPGNPKGGGSAVLFGKAEVEQPQPVQRTGDEVAQQGAFYFVPVLTALQVGVGFVIADEPGVIIAGGTLEIRLVGFDLGEQ